MLAFSLKSKPSINTIRQLISSTLLLLAIGLPFGLDSIFDGLPWSDPVETITVLIIIPSFIAVGWNYLALKPVPACLCIIVIIKVALVIATPLSGLTVKVYPTTTDSINNSWVSTYDTLWNDKVSGILTNPWLGYREFPIDWAINKLTTSPRWENKHSLLDFDDQNDISPWLEISGSLQIPEGHTFSLIANGMAQGTLVARNQKGLSTNIPILRNTASDIKKTIGSTIGEGTWSVSGRIQFEGSDLSLIPVLQSQDGHLKNTRFDDILFQSPTYSESPQLITKLRILSFVFDTFLLLFLTVWFIWLINNILAKNSSYLTIFMFGGLTVILPFLLFPFLELFLEANLQVASLGISIAISGGSLLIWTLWKPQTQITHGLAQRIFLLFSPAVFVFFSVYWWDELNRVPILSNGDDWTAYQVLAFRIAVWGEWLAGGGENIFMHQPLYRYVSAIFHYLFGKSMFAQMFFDVWSVIGATLLIVRFVEKNRLNFPYALLASLLLLVPILVGPIRHHIGRGLAECTAMILLMLTFWLVYSGKTGNTYKLILGGLCGILAYWARQDHLLVIAAIGFFVFEPIVGRFSLVWKIYFEQFQLLWNKFFIYIVLLALGVLLIALRNLWLGGHFGLSTPNHPNLVFVERCCQDNGMPIPINWWQPIEYYRKIRLMLTMRPAGQLPSLFSIPLLFGAGFALLSLFFRPKFLQSYPLAFGFMFLGALVPYYFVNNWGYSPRFSIHILPIAVMSTILVARNMRQHLKRV